MAIIIPSRNVFNPIEHSLVKKNKIDKINVNSTVVNFNKQKGSTVYSEDVWGSEKVETFSAETSTAHNLRPVKRYYAGQGNKDIPQYAELAHCLYSSFTSATVSISIPKHPFDGTITKLYNSFVQSEKNNAGIDYTLQYKIKTYRAPIFEDEESVRQYTPKFKPKTKDSSKFGIGYEIDFSTFTPVTVDEFGIADTLSSLHKITKTNETFIVDSDGSDVVFSGKLYENERESVFGVLQKARRSSDSPNLGTNEYIDEETGFIYSKDTVKTKYTVNEGTVSDFSVSSSINCLVINTSDHLGGELTNDWSDYNFYNLSGIPKFTQSISIEYNKDIDGYTVTIKNIPIKYDWCVLAHIINGKGGYWIPGSPDLLVGFYCYDADDGTQLYRSFDSYGEEIVPLSLVIDIDGDKIAVDLKTGNVTIGSGSSVQSIENNELLQKANIVYDTSSQKSTNLIKDGYQKVVDDYKHGKEVLKLKLAVGEYYDANDNLVISTKDKDLKMLFSIGDEVIPYKNSAYGADVPISTDKNGVAKTFIVVGTRVLYGGVLYQEITLQEKVS